MHTTTEGTHQRGGLVLRRFRQTPSAPSGLGAPLTSESSIAQAIRAVFAAPPAPRAERSLTGLAREVRAEFVEAQRMSSWGRR